ncbi:MAG: hypothetical protein ACI9P5_000976 [Saprospiraceae bacterium]|jgi:hypothetical protein
MNTKLKQILGALSIVSIVFTIYLSSTAFISSPEWGFYGHRKINRMAVFTLPPEMIRFYKKNIEYITEHAVDPDKRRYASKHEAVRHYIDIDAWGENSFKDVPWVFDDALMKYAKYELINLTDTSIVKFTYTKDTVTISTPTQTYYSLTDTFRLIFRNHVMSQYYEDDWIISSTKIDSIFPGFSGGYDLHITDQFSGEGILPYHLNSMYYWLIKAFKDGDYEKILRLSAEYGHYIGDAHVPLHTTKNYNGQLTDQIGIHAFWESRLPELYADSEYNFLVGKALYIKKPLNYFWGIVEDSHKLLDDVLDIEKELTLTYPEDQQMCYDERLDRTIRTQCPEFSRAYHDRMDGMVETRMQDAILSIGSVWFSAWLDAGQPDLDNIEKLELDEEEIKIDASINTRDHSN